MKKLGMALLILFLLIVGYSIENAFSDTTSNGANNINHTSTSGNQTSISGGYSQESSVTYQSGSSSNTTSNSTTNNNNEAKRNPVATSSAPSMSVYGQDSCVIPLAAGVTLIGFSGSFGSYMVDEECTLRKQAKLLNGLGMKVAAISLMCQDENVFEAMMNAGTPCPYQGLIGDAAKEAWLKDKKPTDDKVEQYRKYKESLK
jgi:hypothetical protein|tara:strand:+ start:106 stop:711 length:606 start_codon:yes stop_codon:yes gene_type:complete